MTTQDLEFAESDAATAGEGMTRRRFAAMTAGTLGAIGVGVTTFVVLDGGGDNGTAIRSFDVEIPNDVYVTMSNGEEFVVMVKEAGSGRVLEEHTGVTARNLAKLQSDRLRIIATS